MRKQVIVLYADGRAEILPTPPTWTQMQGLVGGSVEQVRVLDRFAGLRPVYSYLYVHEEGVLLGLPRNETATQLYQRNTRLAFPHSPNPFRAAREHYRRQVEATGATVFEQPEPAPGYYEDPWIAGTAIYFQGYTCEEVTAYWNQEV